MGGLTSVREASLFGLLSALSANIIRVIARVITESADDASVQTRNEEIEATRAQLQMQRLPVEGSLQAIEEECAAAPAPSSLLPPGEPARAMRCLLVSGGNGADRLLQLTRFLRHLEISHC